MKGGGGVCKPFHEGGGQIFSSFYRKEDGVGVNISRQLQPIWEGEKGERPHLFQKKRGVDLCLEEGEKEKRRTRPRLPFQEIFVTLPSVRRKGRRGGHRRERVSRLDSSTPSLGNCLAVALNPGEKERKEKRGKRHSDCIFTSRTAVNHVPASGRGGGGGNEGAGFPLFFSRIDREGEKRRKNRALFTP